MPEWRFPSNDYGENKGINDSGVALFRGTPLKSLAREICQNSLDAAIDEKVKVDFHFYYIEIENLPGHDTLKNAFSRCLDFWDGQRVQDTKDFYKTAISEINKNECGILRISDFNTTGLTGSREEINSNWTNLTKSSGASDKKGTAGGSYGIGKFAPFACSYYSTVFYSTLDIDKERASQGVARLVTFRREQDGQTTQGIGYFGEDKNTPIYDQLLLDPYFTRGEDQHGTDIYIPGYKYAGEFWQKDIIISILDGFLGAIWNNKLEVNVGNTLINKSTVGSIIDLYKDDLMGYADKYYEVLISDKTVWETKDFMGMGEIKLGILIGDQDAPKRVAMIRQTGMKIMDKDRLSGHVPFVGVMFINGNVLNERLRLIENPEHTEWQPDRSKNPLQEKELIKAINSYIKDRIEELVQNSSDDAIDAVGVGNFIPDVATDTNNTANEEVVSDKVIDIEISKVNKSAKTGKIPGESERNDYEDTNGSMEPGGSDEEWFSDDGKIIDPSNRPAGPASIRENGDDTVPRKLSVGLEKFISICVDKDKGKYVLMIVPDRDVDNATIKLFLSAETQKYEAPIVKSMYEGKDIKIERNELKEIIFRGNQPSRISVELDYHDYCSMEVEIYAVEK